MMLRNRINWLGLARWPGEVRRGRQKNFWTEYIVGETCIKLPGRLIMDRTFAVDRQELRHAVGCFPGPMRSLGPADPILISLRQFSFEQVVDTYASEGDLARLHYSVQIEIGSLDDQGGMEGVARAEFQRVGPLHPMLGRGERIWNSDQRASRFRPAKQAL